MPELFWWMGGALIATILLLTSYISIREKGQEKLTHYQAVADAAMEFGAGINPGILLSAVDFIRLEKLKEALTELEALDDGSKL